MTRAEYQTYLASREWALKREAVRERSGNRCERCWTRRMDAVHHKTYERVGNERLEDLQAICDPCHEFLSGKTDADPISDGVSVYLAGPFTSPEWRRDLMEDRRDITLGQVGLGALQDRQAFELARRGLRGGFDFTGPWRVNGDGIHGLIGSGHDGTEDGLGCLCCSGRDQIVDVCKKAISASDVVFAWLPPTASVPAGTLWELGFAAARGKPIAIAQPERSGPWDALDDYWFPIAAANFWIAAETAGKAWDRFIADTWPAHCSIRPWRRAA